MRWGNRKSPEVTAQIAELVRNAKGPVITPEFMASLNSDAKRLAFTEKMERMAKLLRDFEELPPIVDTASEKACKDKLIEMSTYISDQFS